MALRVYLCLRQHHVAIVEKSGNLMFGRESEKALLILRVRRWKHVAEKARAGAMSPS